VEWGVPLTAAIIVGSSGKDMVGEQRPGELRIGTIDQPQGVSIRP